nr:ubiquinol-cytochrome c reductase subunit 10 [Cryptococcus depauperatus CBS 7855]
MSRRLRFWAPTAAIWGVAAGAAVSFLLSDVPLFQKDVLIKVPMLGTYFKGLLDTSSLSERIVLTSVLISRNLTC